MLPRVIHFTGPIKTKQNPAPLTVADIDAWAAGLAQLLGTACENNPLFVTWDGDQLIKDSPDLAGMLYQVFARLEAAEHGSSPKVAVNFNSPTCLPISL